MSENVKNLFTSISPTYDRLNHLLSFHIDKKWRKNTIQSIQFPTSQSIKALDLCAGTLDLSVQFLHDYPHSHVTSLDFSQNMLDYGSHKISAEDQSRIQLVCGDALKLPFEDQSFDVIFCGYGFRNLDDKWAGIQEMKRVLKPQGQILILDFFKPRRFITKCFHHTYGRFILPLVGAIIAKNKDAYTYLYESINQFYSLDQCKDSFKQAGYNHVTSTDFLLGISSLVTATQGMNHHE